MTAVMAISTAKNNAELITQCRDLGYLHNDWVTLDATYGQGRFWTIWRPRNLITNDLDETTDADKHWDFRHLPSHLPPIDAYILDGPYKLNGTSTGRGSSALDKDYGVQSYASWQDRHTLIRDGITEAVRVLKPGGILLVKCQDQVCSGQVRWQTMEFTQHAESLGCTLTDMLHLPSYRAQPNGRSQIHARRNYSTLLVFTKATP